MDNFENNFNNSTNSAENGSVSGFDSVDGKTENPNFEPINQEGYTVTPQGGFYTKQREDIIQDEPASNHILHMDDSSFESDNSYKDSASTEYSNFSHNNGFNPNGNYGYPPPPPNFNKANDIPPYKNPYAKKPKKKFSAGVIIVAAVLAAIIGAGSGIAAVVSLGGKNSSATTIIQKDQTGSDVNINVSESVESVAEAVAEKVTKSVVGIRTTTSVMSFFGGSSESTGEGSGVIYSSDGYIITNYHVIESAAQSQNSKIEVFLNNDQSKSYNASVVGYNISSDLAVLKINVTGLTPVEIGDSSKLKAGQYVVSIGNPGGLEFMGSVTYGIISGLNRTVSTSSSVTLIQTDAAINPGNSGGALLNTKGQLIGINSSKIVAEEFEGMGFAIPVNTVVEKCKNIIDRENEPEPYVGITISERYSSDVLEYYGYPTGAVVLSVDDNSPAAETGITKGDIITEFNGTALKEYTMYSDLLSECSPGDTVSIKIYRSGRYYSAKLKISSNGAQ